MASKSNSSEVIIPLSSPKFDTSRFPPNSILSSDSKIDPKTVYTLKKKIGKGSFGKIWMATSNHHNGDEVAIKILPYEEGNEEINKKLEWEIKIMLDSRGCDHIIQYFGSHTVIKKKSDDTNNSKLWIVMEYCENGSLRSFLNKNGGFGEKYIAAIMKQTLLGLCFMHKTTTTHRDIKSANVLWNSRGQIKLGDLGEALILNDFVGWDEGMYTGTPYFMAPEVTATEKYTEKIDIWSLGVMALELAEVNPPFFSDPPFKVMFQVASKLLIPRLTNPKDYSSEFNDFISKCVQFEADKRLSAHELLSHPFIAAADTIALKELAKKFYDSNKDTTTEITKDKNSKEDEQHSTKQAIAQVVYKDKITGETLTEFFSNLLNWKETNNEIITSLCQMNSLSGSTSSLPSGSSFISLSSMSSNSSGSNSSHGGSSYNLNSNSTYQATIGKSESRLKTRLKGLFNPTDIQKKMERLSILIHLAWKASSASFGVVMANRLLNSTIYESCFVGRELVDWIYQHLQLETRIDAINLVKHILSADLMFGISSRVPIQMNVDSELAFFRFRDSKIKDWHVSYTQSQEIPTHRVLARTSSNLEEKEKPEDEFVMKMTQTTELTERDWALIMAGASPETFKKDEVIVQEGIYNRCIYRILQGTVRVEKIENGKVVVLSRMNQGQMFGEMSVLTQGKTSATIKADSECEIFKTEVSFMYKLFQTEPGMQQRFFKRAAVSLAKKLRELGTNNKKPQPPPIKELEERDDYGSNNNNNNNNHNSNGTIKHGTLTHANSTITKSASQDMNSKDKKYVALFGLSVTEVVIQEFACYLHGLFKEHGQLYVSANYICFYSKVFGKQNKVIIDLDKIERVEVTEKQVLIIKAKKTKLKLHGLLDAYSASSLIGTLRESRRASKDKSQIEVNIYPEEEILSPDDWSLLLGESKCKKYRKDEAIVTEGEWAARIHQIAKGSCRVEKKIDDKKQILGKMDSGELFGEISFLEGVKVTASVVASEDNTEVYIIEAAALSVLFERQPSLCGRFFQYLAQILSARLRERENAMNKK